MKIFLILLIASSLVIAQDNQKSKIEIPAVFSDNMVLQQKSNVPFWGKAEPAAKIRIETGWKTYAQTAADKNGNWNARIKTPAAGGPYEVNLTINDSTIVFKNVLIGEVWLCSGQSNMEMPLAGWPPNDSIFYSDEAIANSANSKIRLFTVEKSISLKPNFNCAGNWDECSPETVHGFSATAYFFGRKLFEQLNIPIGLIHSSWGGTPSEAWTDGEYLKDVPEFKDIILQFYDLEDKVQKLYSWLEGFPQIKAIDLPDNDKWTGLDFNDSECSSYNYDDSRWRSLNLPAGWESSEIGNFDGAVWFRKKIALPEYWTGKKLLLSLGPIDDMDMTFVNGFKIGGYEKDGFWQTERIYHIDSIQNNMADIEIAVRVLDTQGGGGIYGKPELLSLTLIESGEKISLAGEWKYLPVAEYRNAVFYVSGSDKETAFSRPELPIDLSSQTPTALFNGMIAPLIPFALKGAIWYQGESNVGNPSLYRKIFPLMIECWRNKWGQGDFPFYFVQIAPWKYSEGTNSQYLREAQLLSLKTKNTGMAVTMDIGNTDNIHPANKKDVGERLALWALAKNYGKKIPYTGPIYKSMKIKEGKIILYFDFAEGLILKPRDGKSNFRIAGKDKIFYDAVVEVKDNKLIVSSPEVKFPSAVRYCWSDTEEGTLFNKAGLPSPSFRTDDW